MCSALLIHEREIEEADVSFTLFIRVSGARYHLPYDTDGSAKIYIVRMYSLSLQPANLSSQHQPSFPVHGSPRGNWAGQGVRSSADYPKLWMRERRDLPAAGRVWATGVVTFV